MLDDHPPSTSSGADFFARRGALVGRCPAVGQRTNSGAKRKNDRPAAENFRSVRIWSGL